MVNNDTKLRLTSALVLMVLIFIGSSNAYAQVENRWLSVGSFHNFYSNIGSEIETGFISTQQGGWQWPAIYNAQDAQAMKALWLGADNFTDDNGNNFEKRVVHVGPRVTGLGEFYPISINTVSQFEAPEVIVDGVVSAAKFVENDAIEPSLLADREIRTEMNTLLGITVERTARQFSQEYHDNYHIIEYIFTNTGNTDDDDDIELPNQTVEGFIPYFLNRMAPVKATRFTIGNATGWGINTMTDRRGDGLRPAETEDFRAHFSWHGRYPAFMDANYDNIGAPIFVPNITNGYLTADDTTGRLGAYHFVGTVTLHADASASDDTDDPGQPFTMAEEHNDDALFSQNDPFNVPRMQDEYNLMTKGRSSQRHAYRVEPSGESGFLSPTGDPSLGLSGGFGYTYGYGPYTLGPGESVRIVIAEASSGISRELANETGAAFKRGEISALDKNEVVFQGRDSLFQTFERALENFNSGYAIAKPPQPPRFFTVSSLGGGIDLEWQYDGNTADIEGFQIYRATGRVDSTYRLLYEASPNETLISDGENGRLDNPGAFLLLPPIRGLDYYYYIQSIGDINNDATGLTPTGAKLKSSRYYTQSYDPARLQRPAGESMSDIRVVPNPYTSGASTALRFNQGFEGNDRINFFDVPGISTINIYTELGELIKTLRGDKGTGDIPWDLKTDSNQDVVSGIYIARIINEDPNDDEFGEVAIRKIVIIR
tara:strand:- start:14884 stop:17022 length:2139 start_codon:yes stop_codon:yes gene_type:complete